MGLRIEWTDLALESLDEISAYIEGNFSPAVAKRSLAKIVASVGVLSGAPKAGMAMQGYEGFGDVRCIFYRQNQIVYRVLEGRVQVVIVWDGRRSHEAMFDLLLDFFSKARQG